jgi:hypothetical protein
MSGRTHTGTTPVDPSQETDPTCTQHKASSAKPPGLPGVISLAIPHRIDYGGRIANRTRPGRWIAEADIAPWTKQS